ncbi:MAG: DUF4446 family protein [Candidatus Pacebacteria bacterium]|nr:DUF4446 family protein [Candidatus Paceibacterota bacterium]
MLSSYEIDYILAGVAAFLIVLLLAWAIRLELRIRRLLAGEHTKDIPETVAFLKKSIATLDTFQQETEDYLHTVERRLNKSIQAVQTVRFNPFKGMGTGGNQSFATTLLDEKGNGVVISSLYSNDRVSVFAKPLTKATSTYELSGEESESITLAKEALKK